MKRCPDCRLTKPVEAFSKNSARPDGLQFYCKECYAARAARTYRTRQARKGKLVRERVVAPEGHKYCRRCDRISALDNWHRNSTSSDGYASYCKPCRREMGRAQHLRSKFGLTEDQFHDRATAQGGRCAICRSAAVKHTDHDHESGAVRDLLCGPCNMGLGQFGDDPQRLEAAARYLRRHRFALVKGCGERSALEEGLREFLLARRGA